ncbi:MAG: SUMF1/EgtB/PvdO family nonheme iron enzyme [Bacteroidetes bacterium]|nr:SUMF1/EgtB/PvdO family nonheme iron enzyme [Bacteroidota bacterium]
MLLKFLPISLIVFIITGCFKETHQEGWEYNNPQNGGFEKVPFYEQETPPDMVLIEGGALAVKTTAGTSDSVICAHFYISRYEETNGQYLAYVSYLKKYYSLTTYQNALPDTTVWQHENLPDSAKKYLLENYFRNPLYKDYPVVGVSPEQVKNYAAWKTDRINEFILIREEIFAYTEPLDSSTVFATEKYLTTGYYAPDEPGLIDLNPEKKGLFQKNVHGERLIRFEDGILMPRYRLVGWNEWLQAALAIGDGKPGYIKTLPEETYGKKIRAHHFGFLKVTSTKQKHQKSGIPVLPVLQKIGTVYAGIPDNYGVYGLSAGVREMVQLDDSVYGVAGGCWKEAENYAAVYKKTNRDSLTYTLPREVKTPDTIAPQAPGVYGFRLAMDRFGDPQGYQPTRRVKGK